MLGRVESIWEECRRVGLGPFSYRVAREISQRSGLSCLMRPIKEFRDDYFLRKCRSGTPDDPDEFLSWWKEQKNLFFIDTLDNYPNHLNRWLEEGGRGTLYNTAREACSGRILAFRGWVADYGSPVDWNKNPAKGNSWPSDLHSLRLLSRSRKEEHGDIKLTWEMGRFLHIPDIVRAFFLSGDEELIQQLFDQISSFETLNPLHRGPHWISEQEVAIRTCMFVLVLSVLRNSQTLTGSKTQLLFRQIAAGAEYCYKEIEYSRQCIRNNHLIGGALGMYLPGCILPWHKYAVRWRKKGKRLLLEALRTQWHSDGGYTQPSHNYHRLSINYLLWVLRLAQIQSDEDLVEAILSRFRKSFDLLNEMVDDSSGHLPNWGPNDGAQFCPWTSCEYPDFRPLLTSMRYALSKKRQYQDGPWDEQLLWLWGEEAVSAPVSPAPKQSKRNFNVAGLHIIRRNNDFSVLRCGPITSRYGQQADQLHVDVWWRGRNVLIDPGSYLYGDPSFHDWFRSTHAHNTLTIDNESQMVPYRQFLFLKWPNAGLLRMPEPPRSIIEWCCGWHDGYRRLERDIIHIRVLAALRKGGWLVVDWLKALSSGRGEQLAQRWHMADGAFSYSNDRLDLDLDVGTFSIVWRASDSMEARMTRASDSPVDGWTSRYYGRKEPSPTLTLQATLRKEFCCAAVFGDERDVEDADLQVENMRVIIEGDTLVAPNVQDSVKP